eukprot:scaffold20546_cov22-Tisochrysis_lutea.AAC.2
MSINVCKRKALVNPEPKHGTAGWQGSFGIHVCGVQGLKHQTRSRSCAGPKAPSFLTCLLKTWSLQGLILVGPAPLDSRPLKTHNILLVRTCIPHETTHLQQREVVQRLGHVAGLASAGSTPCIIAVVGHDGCDVLPTHEHGVPAHGTDPVCSDLHAVVYMRWEEGM